MRRKWIMAVILLLLFVLSGYIAFMVAGVKAAQTEMTFTGYLLCRSCATAPSGMAACGTNTLENPERHTVQCLKMPSCVASGFGIVIKSKEGIYGFYPFEPRGSDLAYRNIIGRTVKTDNLLVTVTGKLRNRQITVDQIVEK